MLLPALIFVPALFAVLVFFIRRAFVGRFLLVAAAGVHAVLTALAWIVKPPPVFDGWFALDSLGLIFLSVTSLLFLAASVYAMDYLKRETAAGQRESEEGEFLFINAPEARFAGCLLFFLASMTLVILSQHLGVLWVAVELTTLASAPLIYFHRHRRSLEATWKYLLLCSVGIALALLGNFFLAVAASVETSNPVSFLLNDLVSEAVFLNLRWLKAAFICFLVGYGTKMGLAPMHTWLPDAHSESPSLVSALLSGALLNCAFLALLRGHQICVAAGQAAFSGELLAGFGLFSLLVAAVFVLGQTDYKRMLAYSSVEHMGLLALGVGVGGLATAGAVFHAINHSLIKAGLFLVSGNILGVFKTKVCTHVRGLFGRMPVTGILWVAGLFAITGAPPFGSFMSEVAIFNGMISKGRYGLLLVCLAALTAVFWGMARVMLPMAQGRPEENGRGAGTRESFLSVLPAVVLMGMVLFLGVVMPGWLETVLADAAQILGARL